MNFSMRAFKPSCAFSFGLALLSLSACSAPGGTGGESHVDVDDLLGEAYASAPVTDSKAVSQESIEKMDEWWRHLNDPQLEELVDTMLAQNLDLEAAVQSTLAAFWGVTAAGAANDFTVDVGIDASRSFTTPVTGGDRAYSTSLRPNATIGWQEDLFGGLKSQELAALGAWRATEQEQEALKHSLIAAVVRQRVALSVLARRIALSESIIASRQSTLRIVEGRYSGGVAGTDAVNVHQAKENLAGAQAALPGLMADLKQTEHFLQELLGQKPGADMPLVQLGNLPPLEQPPAGVPASLLDRRPDLRAARFRNQAQAANVDVAISALYPNLRLTATGGWESTDLEDIFDADRLFGSLLADLSMRIWGSWRLQANVDIEWARLRASAAAYRAAVLSACREVEDALVAESRLREQWQQVQTQVSEARLAETQARDRYASGVGSLLTVLDTERRRANAEEFGLLLEQSIWNSRIDLHLALGGNWAPSQPYDSIYSANLESVRAFEKNSDQ